MPICKIAWASFSNDPDGSVRPCCIYKGNIKKPDGSKFYVQNDSVEDIFNSEYMVNLRNEFLNGNKPKGCETCWIDESNGYKSKRQIYNEIFESKDLSVDITKPIDFPIDYQIIISNACNLKCRSCGTGHSTQWQKEMNNLPENVPGVNNYVHQFHMPHGQPGGNNSKLIEDLSKWTPKLKRLEIVGGEPFYIEKWKTIWDYLIESGYSKNIDLAMSTNTSIYNEEQLEKITSNFKAVGIGLSIDGMGEIYDYLRKNASWEISSDNCKKYHDFFISNRRPGLSFNYTYTISWLNAYNLPEFHDWVKENTPEFRIWNNIVHYPNHMSIKMLPDEEKQKIDDKWKSYNWGKYESDVMSVLNFMWSEPQTEETIKEQYKNFTFFDYVRGENTYNVIKHNHPSLVKYF